MLHVEDIYYSNFTGGMLDGACGITIEFGLKRDVSVLQVVNAIRDFGRTRFVRLLGDLYRNPQEDLETLVSVLAEQGVLLSALLKGTEKAPWSNAIPYRIAQINEEPWLMYAAQEIRYAPSVSKNIPLPKLHETHKNAFLYIVPSRDTSASDVLEFVEKYPLFRIFSAPLKVFRKTIPIKEEA